MWLAVEKLGTHTQKLDFYIYCNLLSLEEMELSHTQF